jgi:hypothetical protein
MKGNTIKQGGHKGVYATLALMGIAAILSSGIYGFFKLQGIYEEQCEIVDFAKQIEITSGKMVKPDVIAENLSLRKGANLARIDFARKREEILKKIPTLREVSITRIQPDKLIVTAEEREPIARLGIRGVRRVTGRVVDSEGVVFLCQRGTYHLPTISEPRSPGTGPGRQIGGRARAALSLIEACQKPEFQELNVQDVDISRPDYLFATLGDYSRLKISWEGMDEAPSEKSRAELHRHLDHLVRTIRSRVGVGTKIWNATMPDHIFADTQGDSL